MEYRPKPIDTSDIILPDEILELVEYIAKNTHDVWASGKMNEGYIYGEVINTEKKTHSSLVPYEDLPESEKNYDRNTLLETIRLLLKMGFKIEKREVHG